MTRANLILLLAVSLLVMLSAAESKRLNGKKTSVNDEQLECESGAGAEEGDNCSLVAATYGMTLGNFLDINPNISCASIFPGQWLCLKATYDEKTSAKNELLCAEFYGAKEGDTCSNVADTFKLSPHDFLAINPNLNCDSFPFAGQWLCVEAA